MADGFVWYELMTNDVERARSFYAAVVGWEIRDAGMPGIRYQIFGTSGRDVGGIVSRAEAGAGEGAPAWLLHIHTARLDEELGAVAADGGAVLKPAQEIPGGGRFAVVADPQGVTYMLFEPGSRETPPRLRQMEAGNVGWHELLTGDAEKAVEFYTRHYGWERDYAHDMGPMGVYQTFRTDQPLYTGGIMSIRSCPGVPAGMRPHWKLYFLVEDLEAAERRVGEAGGRVTGPPMDVPGGSRVLMAVDDLGGEFALMRGPRD